MLNIDDFLKKFKKITLPNETTRRAVSSAVYDTTGVAIDISRISVKNNIVYINTKPMSKNDIFIQKTKILENVKKKLGDKAPKNIL